MNRLILAKSRSDHRHAFIIPKSRLSDNRKGLFFLLWACECGKEKASDLLPRARIEELAREYRERKTKEGISQNPV